MLFFSFFDELAKFGDGGGVGPMQGVLVAIAPCGSLLFQAGT